MFQFTFPLQLGLLNVGRILTHDAFFYHREAEFLEAMMKYFGTERVYSFATNVLSMGPGKVTT